MDVNGDSTVEETYEAATLTYPQGFVRVWKESHGCRDDALMHDRAIVGVYTGTPEQRGEQLFRAWVEAGELPSVLAQWATALR